jgi:hypothetical protein
MSKLSLEVPHTLGREEATRRLKDKLPLAQGEVTDLHHEWNDHTLSFDFQTMGMKIAGTMAVEETAVHVDIDLPWAASMVKGMIEQRVRQELGEVLRPA